MTANWKNHYTDYAVHHVTGTVHGWQPVLLFPDILSIFVDEFNRMTKRWGVSITGYVIMPEHFHMLLGGARAENVMKFIRGGRRSVSGKVRQVIESNNEQLREFCSASKIILSSFYTKTGGKSAFRFWKEKPRVFPISRETDVNAKLDYIHNNPVRRGLVKSPGEWKYSSFGFYRDQESVRLRVGDWRQDVINSILTHQAGRD